MTEPCIDCGLPSKEGSPWCEVCDGPIYESPREVWDKIKAELWGES